MGKALKIQLEEGAAAIIFAPDGGFAMASTNADEGPEPADLHCMLVAALFASQDPRVSTLRNDLLKIVFDEDGTIVKELARSGQGSDEGTPFVHPVDEKATAGPHAPVDPKGFGTYL